MKKLLGSIAGVMVMVGITAVPVAAHAADNPNSIADVHKLDQRLDNAASTLGSIQSVKLKGVPDWIASKAKCIAVVPGLIKGAFIIGAEWGEGVATCRTAHGWSGPVFIRMAGGSWGFQIGGQGTDLVMVAMNNKGMQDLLQSRFKIGGTAAVAAGPIGRRASADTNLFLQDELLSYSRSHGLFAGVDLSGVTVSENVPDTVAMYGGKYYTFDQILSGRVPAPTGNPAVQRFMHVVNEYFNRSRYDVKHETITGQPKEH